VKDLNQIYGLSTDLDRS